MRGWTVLTLTMGLWSCGAERGTSNPGADQTEALPSSAASMTNTSTHINDQTADADAPEREPSTTDRGVEDGSALAPSDPMETASMDVEQPLVEIETSMGSFILVLNREAAPDTVANFLRYVDSGFYDGADGAGATIFHRVIMDFMVQGGGLLSDGARKVTAAAIRHESPNGLMNQRGTVAMARTGEIDSATSQFFINHSDNPFLDYTNEQEPGYVVFGEVMSGMAIIDAIANVATDANDVPIEAIVINHAIRL